MILRTLRSNAWEARLAEEGFAIVPDVLDEELCAGLVAATRNLLGDQLNVKRGGRRDALARVAEVRALPPQQAIQTIVESVLGVDGFAVQGLVFDKTPAANWKVPFHQDLMIPVREPVEVDGFGPWTVKDGIPHGQAPVDVLENLLVLRLHLDHCGDEHGPLRVIPGSHRRGRLSDSAIDDMHVNGPVLTCAVSRGGALLMRPLLLHASSAAARPIHRRVVHLLFAARELPGGLDWHDRVPIRPIAPTRTWATMGDRPGSDDDHKETAP